MNNLKRTVYMAMALTGSVHMEIDYHVEHGTASVEVESDTGEVVADLTVLTLAFASVLQNAIQEGADIDELADYVASAIRDLMEDDET